MNSSVVQINPGASYGRTLLPVLSRNWCALALRGLFAVSFGLAAFLLPGITLASLILPFGAYTLAGGVPGSVVAVTDRPGKAFDYRRGNLSYVRQPMAVRAFMLSRVGT